MLKMARVLHNLLSFLSGLARHLRVVGYWSLVYGCCCVCAAAALLKLWWSVVLRPSATFRWASREIPPACLNDTSLGTHCYVRIKVGRGVNAASERARATPRRFCVVRMEGTPRGGVGERETGGATSQAVVSLKPVGSQLIVSPLPTSLVVVVVVVRSVQVVLNGQFLHPAAA